MKKCSKGHEILAKAKFCPECAEPVPADAPETVTCIGKDCEQAILKSHQFCPACGTPQAAGDALEAAEEALTAFTKARDAQQGQHDALPEVTETDVDTKSVDALIKAHTTPVLGEDNKPLLGTDGQPLMAFDGQSLIEDLLKSNLTLTAQNRKYADQHRTHLALVTAGQDALVKSFGAVVRELRATREAIAELKRAPLGRKIGGTIVKGAIVTDEGGDESGPIAALRQHKVVDVLAKATVNPKLLGQGDFDHLQELQHHTLADVAQILDLGLAQRALAVLQAGAH